MSALTAPFIVAALVLCVAGVAKLRSPTPAALAVVDARPAGEPRRGPGLRRVRARARGASPIVDPGGAAVAVACLYALFAV